MFENYADEALLASLQGLTARRRRAFSAGCLELLVRHFGTNRQGDPAVDREIQLAVDGCWAAVLGVPDVVAMERAQASMEDLLAGDESEDLGVGEHVVAGVYYAARCAVDADEGYAELVAKNLYEAADFIVIGLNQDSTAPGGTARDIIAHPLVQAALGAIDQTLDIVSRSEELADDSNASASPIRAEISALAFPQIDP